MLELLCNVLHNAATSSFCLDFNEPADRGIYLIFVCLLQWYSDHKHLCNILVMEELNSNFMQLWISYLAGVSVLSGTKSLSRLCGTISGFAQIN